MNKKTAKAGFYMDLIRTVFQAVDEQGKLRNRVVAFTSATPHEGVTHVVDILAKELATQTDNRVLRVDATVLQSLQIVDPSQVAGHCQETGIENLLTLCAAQSVPNVTIVGASGKASHWESAPEFRAECLKALRWNFDYVLIDCPSLVSPEATTLAPLVDGVSVVVKAAQTRRGQIQRCQQIIQKAGGNFLGFILNQRQYPIPNWLYRRL